MKPSARPLFTAIRSGAFAALWQTVCQKRPPMRFTIRFWDFASYAFNKAHAVCYAQVAYETALSQVPLSPGVYGGADDLGTGQHHQDFRVYRRVPGAGHCGAAPGCESVGRSVYRNGRGHSLWSGRGEKYRHGLCGQSHAGAAGERAVYIAGGFLPADERHRSQQAHGGKPHQMRCHGLLRCLSEPAAQGL